jgi:hypothetical protein
MTSEPPAHLLPLAGTLGPEEQCRFCPEQVRFGKTVNGKRAPFDCAEPHVNHWSTCAGRDRARKAFPKGSQHPQHTRRRA